MNTNTITSIRIANLAESKDATLYTWIDFDNLKIYGLTEGVDIESKKRYFKDAKPRGKVKIVDVLEDGLKVAVIFKLIRNEIESDHFGIYRFNDLGMLIGLQNYSGSRL